jgi:hypothetical protein
MWCRVLHGAIAVGSLLAQEPATVGTHYFYWYKWPTEHFGEPGAPGPEGHAHHFERPQQVDYEDPAWHRDNFRAMGAAGIDAALPVYWGAPGAYDRPNLAFSRRGLPAMVTALEELAARGTPAPKLGLFYDTSTLANDVRGAAPRGGKADLTTDAGRTLFCRTVVEYFEAIPGRHRARHRGGVLVVLYVSGFAAAWDRTLGAALRAAFAQHFAGDRLCLIADASWGDIGQDLTTAWGAALWGPQLHPGVAQLGPGYDDRAVPGRRTPLREREDGAFYGWSWQQALRHRPELVLLETWNEMHEGTELCRSRELGDRYLELTRTWIGRLRQGADPGAPIALRWPEPQPTPDRSWGGEAAGANEVACDFAGGQPAVRGLRAVRCEDGAFVHRDGVLQAAAVPDGCANYLYFQVSDAFAFDVEQDFELVVTRRAGDAVVLEFDSHDPRGVFRGSYTACRPASVEARGEWTVERYELGRARFANRQNGGADLRLGLPARRAAVRSLVLRRKA